MGDNIKMDFKEIELCGCGLIYLASGLVVGSCEYSNEPSNSIQSKKFLD